MMKYAFIAIIFLPFLGFGQSNYRDSLIQARREKEENLLDSAKGTLTKEDLEHFKSLHYFHIDTNYIIQAQFVKNIGKRFKMPTSTEREPIYRRYGYLYFEIENKACTLTVYQNMELRKKKEYKNYFFVPFKDLTSGIYTYGGGRYLDFYLSEKQTIATIDFNLSYNPYCAYSHRYSCPIPPAENNLNISIISGEKTPIYWE